MKQPYASSLPPSPTAGDVIFLDSGSVYFCFTTGVWTSVGSGGGGVSLPPRIVQVDPTIAEVAGKSYQTWAAADAYVAAQTPSASDRWGIKITGNNSENIVVRSWVAILGEPGETILSGNLTSAVTFSVGSTSPYEALVSDCRVESVATSGTTEFIDFFECEIAGGTPTDGLLIAWRGTITGGDWRNVFQFPILFSAIGQVGASPPVFGFANDFISCQLSIVGESSTFYGGRFRNCRVEAGNTFNAGTYYFYSGTFQGTYTLASGTVMSLYNVACEGASITVDPGTTLSTFGCAHLDVVDNGGTWTNEGDLYDNRTSGLTATETQGAIDELAALSAANKVNLVFSFEPDQDNPSPTRYMIKGLRVPFDATITGVTCSGHVTGSVDYEIYEGAASAYPGRLTGTRITPAGGETWDVSQSSDTQVANGDITPSGQATNNSIDDNLGTTDSAYPGGYYQWNWNSAPRRLRRSSVTINLDAAITNVVVNFWYIPPGETSPGNYVLFDSISAGNGPQTNQVYTGYITSSSSEDWVWADGVYLTYTYTVEGLASLAEFDAWYFTEDQAYNASMDTTLTGWTTSLTEDNMLSLKVTDTEGRADHFDIELELTPT